MGRRLAMAIVASALLGGCAAGSKSGALPVPGTGRTVYQAPVKSLVELRFKNVVRQAYDLSCGAAALATILNHYYQEPVAEQDVIEAMLQTGNREKILRDGFSLLELKQFAERNGYVAAGYQLERVDQLSLLKVPAITLVNVRGYAHFVVIKSVAEGQVYIADPAFGNRSRSLKGFDREWNRVILVVLSERRNGNEAFFQDGTLRGRPAEVMLLFDRGWQSIAPRSGEFGLK